MASQAAWAAFFDAWSPAYAGLTGTTLNAARQGVWARGAIYRQRWAYYANTLFEDETILDSAWRVAGLYRHTRPLYNPTKRAVDLIVGSIYPGVLSLDGAALPDGFPTAIPLAADTAPALQTALGQVWQWSNFQAQKALIVRWGAALGDVLVETVDDVARGKVYFQPVWPGDVASVTLDAQGNLKGYTLEYWITAAGVPAAGQAPTGAQMYLFRKDVDSAQIRTFRDGEPWAPPGAPSAVIDHPYGFVPARWFRHLDIGSDHGAPQLYGSFNKIPRLMALASHIHTQIHKKIEDPKVIAGDGSITNISATAKRDDDDPSLDTDDESLLLLQASTGTTVASLTGDLPLADALAECQHLLEEIEKDQPILRMYDQLRAMSQVTGPAAERLVGDAAAGIYELQAAYDAGVRSLGQQALAIAGWRLRQGHWRPPSAQQRVFAGFDLTSYAAGQLAFDILPRPVLPPTRIERQQAAQTGYQAIKAARDAGIPLELALEDAGWDAKKIARLKELQAASVPPQLQPQGGNIPNGQTEQGNPGGSPAQGEPGQAAAAGQGQG